MKYNLSRQVNGLNESAKMGDESYRDLFDLAADPMIILDQDCIIKEINHTAYIRLGYTWTEMLGRNIADFLPPAYRTLSNSRYDDVRNRGYIIYESAIIHKDGSVFPVEIHNRAMEWKGEKVYFVVIRDIYARKKSELAALIIEKKWRLLFENMTTGFALHDVITDKQGKVIDYRFLEINPAYERLTGLNANKIIGHTVLEVLPGTEPYWIDIFGRVALSGEPTSCEN
jgi:two-component system sensor histidine kinase/response regulator